MSFLSRIRWLDVMVAGAIVGYAAMAGMNRGPRERVELSDFARQVDLTPLYQTAVHADGRLRSFESHAKTYMGFVSGARTIRGQSNGFTYLDMMLRPESYLDTDVIYVKHKDVRRQILDALTGNPHIDMGRRSLMEKSGMIARRFFQDPAVSALLQRLSRDLIRTAKTVDAITSALTVADPRFLSDQLRLIPPPDARSDQPWMSMSSLSASTGAPDDSVHAGLSTPAALPGLDKQLQQELAGAWKDLQAGWRSEDAAKVNAFVAKLASLLPTISPALYPAAGRLEMESWYFRYKSMTWVWLFYLASAIPLLMAVIYRWERARTIGLALFIVAFLTHTASVAVRWYVSGRWPNANMFEAVTTSAWMGGLAAIILERVGRRTPLKNLFALGSALVSMVALMAAYFLPAQLDSSISNKMAALNDVWLYIHTNMIIWSYAVIGLACVPALLQLRHRWCLAWDDASIPKVRLLILPIAVGVLNYTAYRLLMHAISPETMGLTLQARIGISGGFISSLMIIVLEAAAARSRALAGGVSGRSVSGGAASLIGGGGGAFLTGDRPTASQVFDGATMVLVELSFIMLWTGIIMGAIWADHSWGRPWGWDPKEVFALNTFIIFLILIHVRLKVRDKAFWTAVLAVVGFEVMMFNWIVVNFVITGLHSYA